MKTNRLFITVAIIIAGSFFVNISAQDALKAIAKKCETADNVDISVVRSRDKETKKVNRYIMNVDFKDNEALKKEILAAFEKDRGNADREVEDRKNGKVKELMLRFGSSSYTFSEGSNGKFSFSLIENYGNKDGALLKQGYGYYPNDIRPLQTHINMEMQNLESIDWEEMSENIKKGFEDIKVDYEINMKNFEIDMKEHEENMKNH